jgi:hypothetical protein
MLAGRAWVHCLDMGAQRQGKTSKEPEMYLSCRRVAVTMDMPLLLPLTQMVITSGVSVSTRKEVPDIRPTKE